MTTTAVAVREAAARPEADCNVAPAMNRSDAITSDRGNGASGN